MLRPLLFACLLSFAQGVAAQAPYLDGNLLIIPAVEIGAEKYRVELVVDAATNPVSLNLHYAEPVENVSSYQASSMTGVKLTVPKLSYGGKSYELSMTLVSESPVVFQLTSVLELAANFPATTLRTYAPEACSADVKLLREETFLVQDHSEGYKGDVFDYRQIEVPGFSFKKSAIISLVTDEVLIVAEQHPEGFPEQAVYLTTRELTVAPDFGDQNDPDYPVAFSATILVDSVTREQALTRSDGRGGLKHVLVTGDTVNLGRAGGVVEAFYDLRLGVDGALFFFLRFEADDKEYLVKQSSPNSGLSLLLATGDSINSGEEDTIRSVGEIYPITPNVFDQAIAKVDVLDENESVEGFAYLTIDGSTGSNQCLATDSAISCGGVLLSTGEQLLDFSSDGATTGAAIKNSQGSVLAYKVTANPIVERINPNEEFQGHTFRSLRQPKVCESRNALYFIGGFFDTTAGFYDELMRIDENGTLTKITDFRSLLADGSLDGSVPDEVRRWTMGYNCDAVFFMHGPSAPDSSKTYEGYWASYLSGETMKILDSTFKDADGTVYTSGHGTSGIDPSTNSETIASTGPNGEFYSIPRVQKSEGTFLSTYVVSTKPQSCPQ